MPSDTFALDDVIAALEGAGSGWDSRHDELIARYLGWDEAPDGWHAVGVFFPDGALRRTSYSVNLPHWTRSLDAALSLKPEGHCWGVSWSPLYGLETWVQDGARRGECFQGYAPEGDKTDATAARAFCIAALKARAAQPGGSPDA